MKNKTILFICKGNSGRSQMAEAFFNHLFKKSKAKSAGTKPDKKIHPWTVQVMKEVGIDISQQKPKLLTDKLMKEANRIIVMETGLSKFILPEYSSKLEDWRTERLLGKPISKVRKIRNRIKRKVKQLIKEIEQIKKPYN